MCVVAVLMCIDLLLGKAMRVCVVAVLMCIDLLLGEAMRVCCCCVDVHRSAAGESNACVLLLC